MAKRKGKGSVKGLGKTSRKSGVEKAVRKTQQSRGTKNAVPRGEGGPRNT